MQVCISFSSEGSKHKMEWPMGLYVYFSLEIMRKMYDFFLQNMESRLPTTCRLTNGVRLSFKHVCSNLPAKNQRTTSDLSCEIERFCRTRKWEETQANKDERIERFANRWANDMTKSSNGCPKLMLMFVIFGVILVHVLV